ncbi:MAG TPA: AarF/UbiB family protein [Pyrinomonadaceae bacterium]|jgi:hypothetical protein
MTQAARIFSKSPDIERLKADAGADLFHRRWHLLCERYLPVKTENSIWRFSRDGKAGEPSQGWKLHISATVLEACDVFEKAAPHLTSADVQFKAPKSLDELSKINCGLEYGYHQVGKFITIYPSTKEQAVRLARELHELTIDFIAVSVPFDEQYLPDSSVFYRYGGFVPIEMIDENGKVFSAVRKPSGEIVPDDRFQAVPEWMSNPFQIHKKNGEKDFNDTPLGTTYKIFRAITQRGKGGTYQALDFSSMRPRLSIVKEGRRHGETGWNGQDGYSLVKNEFEVLTVLNKISNEVPRVFASFEIYGNFYLAMEYVEGRSLNDIMKPRQRRFSVKQVLELGIRIAEIIENIHRAGWVWNDCKPANLIVTANKSLRPIDFEGAYPVDKSEPFDWKTKGFSKSAKDSAASSGKSADTYALGAVVYFLLTGRLYDADEPVEIGKLRRNVPQKLIKITEKLLRGPAQKLDKVKIEFKKILNSI